ncbi:hypothetical protein Droror1_Dr00009095 [Drosera rotundifolia]
MARLDQKTGPSLEFFKVYIPHSSSHHMLIPPAFPKYFRANQPQRYLIRNSVDRTWVVNLEKLGDDFYFTDDHRRRKWGESGQHRRRASDRKEDGDTFHGINKAFDSSRSIFKYASFSVTLTTTFMEWAYVSVPSKFVKRHIRRESQEIYLEVSKRLWTVKLCKSMNYYWRLTAGHECIFELIDDLPVTLRVSIVRCQWIDS